MTCKCGSNRIASAYLKHNDTAGIQIPHLDLDLDGYMPYFGCFSGDDTTINVCLDCGQLQGWKAVSDAQIMEDDRVQKIIERREAEKALPAESTPCKTCGGYGLARGGSCWNCGGTGREPD